MNLCPECRGAQEKSCLLLLRTTLQYMTACFVPRIHFGQITSNHMLVTVIENLKKTTISRVSEVRVSIARCPFSGSGITGWAQVWECLWCPVGRLVGDLSPFHHPSVQTGCLFLMLFLG